MSSGNVNPFAPPLVFARRSLIFGSFFLLFLIFSSALMCFMDNTCFLTELFFLERVSLQASHLRFPDTVVRPWSLNSSTLSHADTFGSTDPRTFLFFSAGLVRTFLFREILAFSGVLNLAPALAATSNIKDLNIHHLHSSSSMDNHSAPPF